MEKTNTEALKITLASLEKKYGKGIVMKLGSKKIADVPTISTGSIKLDIALGIGGLPCGRITEIYGPEASGKTTLALHCIAEAQKKGGVALIIDTEHAFDKAYAKRLGIDIQNLLICQPDYGEQALDVAEHMIKSNQVDIVVIDSVSALVPEAELKGEMGDHNVGGQARLMSKAMRKLTAIIHKTGVVCLFINQIRHKVGVIFGSPETTSGGNALKFYASVRLEIRKGPQLKDKQNERIGHKARIKVVKNKLAAPFKEVTLDILYGKGISRIREIVDNCLSLGIIKKTGTWFSYKDTQLGQGYEALYQLLVTDKSLRKKLVEVMREQLKNHSEAT